MGSFVGDPVNPPRRPQPAQPQPVTIVGGALTVGIAPQPLPPNAAEETGGNLDIQTAALNAMVDLIEINARILATLEAIRLQLAGIGDNAIEPADLFLVH